MIDEDVFLIDEHNLIEEWRNQPKLYHDYAFQLANARLDYSEARTELEVTEAELDYFIRNDPVQYGVTKITEGSVEKTIKLQKEWQAKVSEVSKAKHKVDVLEAAVRTLEHRKAALDNFVTLYVREYYCSPKVNEDIIKLRKRNQIDTAE